MRGFSRLFWILAAVFFSLAITYGTWSWLYDAQNLTISAPAGGASPTIEWAGTTTLALVGVMSTLIAFYLRRTHRAQGGELPEDRGDANIDDGDAEQGLYPPWSWWPVTLGGGAALLSLGMAIGVWLAIIGATIVVVALYGWIYEYYRGNFGH